MITAAEPELFEQVQALRNVTSATIWPSDSVAHLRQAFGVYEAAIATCAWQQSSRPLWDWQPGTAVTMHLPPTGWKGNVSSETCSVPDAARHGGWLFKRIGPLTSTGGYDWQQLYESDALALAPVLKEAGEIWITSVGGMFRDVRGEVIGYPPLHNHHSQLFQQDRGRATGALSLNHQDTACYPEAGGEWCKLMALPEGFGMRISVPLTLNAALNDIRPAHSAPLSWFFEVAVQYTTTPQRHVDAWRTQASPGPLETELQLFRIPSDAPSLAWVASWSPVKGRILAMWQHCHSTAGLAETWYIAADPTALGLLRAPMDPIRHVDARVPGRERVYKFNLGGSQFGAPAWDAWDHPVAAADERAMRLASLGSAVEAKRLVLESMLRQSIPFSCVGRTQLGLGDIGDRQPMFTCFEGGLYLQVGQPLTGLFWYDPAVATKAPPFFQHIHYQAWISREPDWNQDYYVFLDTSQFYDVKPLGFALAELGQKSATGYVGLVLAVSGLLIAAAGYRRVSAPRFSQLM